MEVERTELRTGRGGGLGRGPRLLVAVVIMLLAAGPLAACGDDDDDDGGDEAGSAPISSFAIVAPEKGNDYGWNQQGVEAAEQVAADLGIEVEVADVLAANTSMSGNLGIVISADDTNWNKQAGGFVAGARSENPDVEIELAQIGQAGYADTAGGKRVTEAVIADGADVVFGMGDGSSFGMLQAVEAADGVTFIDVIGDKTPIDDQGVLLSSVLWSFDGLYEDAINDIGAGTFGEQGYELDLENGGISLLRTDLIDDETWSELEDIKQQIIDGEIKVPLTEDKSKVEDLIAQG